MAKYLCLFLTMILLINTPVKAAEESTTVEKVLTVGGIIIGAYLIFKMLDIKISDNNQVNNSDSIQAQRNAEEEEHTRLYKERIKEEEQNRLKRYKCEYANWGLNSIPWYVTEDSIRNIILNFTTSKIDTSDTNFITYTVNMDSIPGEKKQVSSGQISSEYFTFYKNQLYEYSKIYSLGNPWFAGENYNKSFRSVILEKYGQPDFDTTITDLYHIQTDYVKKWFPSKKTNNIAVETVISLSQRLIISDFTLSYKSPLYVKHIAGKEKIRKIKKEKEKKVLFERL